MGLKHRGRVFLAPLLDVGWLLITLDLGHLVKVLGELRLVVGDVVFVLKANVDHKYPCDKKKGL